MQIERTESYCGRWFNDSYCECYCREQNEPRNGRDGSTARLLPRTELSLGPSEADRKAYHGGFA
ncbi:MAG: hypothetical protein ABL907_10495, partial [Hyphomicrobium sp.]